MRKYTYTILENQIAWNQGFNDRFKSQINNIGVEFIKDPATFIACTLILQNKELVKKAKKNWKFLRTNKSSRLELNELVENCNKLEVMTAYALICLLEDMEVLDTLSILNLSYKKMQIIHKHGKAIFFDLHFAYMNKRISQYKQILSKFVDPVTEVFSQ